MTKCHFYHHDIFVICKQEMQVCEEERLQNIAMILP